MLKTNLYECLDFIPEVQLRSHIFLYLIIFVLSIRVQAVDPISEKKVQTAEPVKSVDASGADKVNQTFENTYQWISNAFSQSKDLRQKANYFFLVNYGPIDLLIPGKLGLTVGAIRHSDKTWEIEYLKGSLSAPFVLDDLGKMVDERISVVGRSYFGGNSFNMSYGLSYVNFSLFLGDKLLNRVSAGAYPSVDLVEVQSLAGHLGLGNRWSFNKNITLGIDWFSWTQPVVLINKKAAFLDYASNQQDKDDVDRTLKLITYFPRFSVLKMQFGMLF